MRMGAERGIRLGLVILLALTGACGDGPPTAPGAEALTDAEVERLALDDEAFLTSFIGERFTAEAARATGGELELSVVPIITEGTFSWTRNCPGGGEVSAEGSFTREVDREAGTAAVSVEGEKRKDDCVHRRGDVEITVNAEAAFEAHRAWARSGESWELSAATKSVEGEFSYATSDGRAGECEFELRAEWDPEARQVHVTGTYCGRDVDRIVERGGEADAGG